MKDIDFDELDRAVNSLMSNVPQNDPPKVDDDVKVVTLGVNASSDASSRPQPESTPRPAAPAMPAREGAAPLLQSESELSRVKGVESDTDVKDSAPSSIPAPTPAARRGRFMDVVRPSARGERRPFPASAVSRQGVTLQPTSAPAVTAPSAEEPVVEPEAATTQPEPEVYAEVEELSAATMPVEDTGEVAVAPVIEDAPMAEAADEIAPLDSPFLPGAKVEKRPLGRPLEAAPAADLAAELAESTSELMAGSFGVGEDTISPNKDAQLPEQPLPAELGSELLSIETSAENLPQEAVPAMPEPEVAPTAPVSGPTSTLASTPAPTPAETPLRAMTSIPQQYKVQSSPENRETPVGAIYDTQPLAHPAEKKPGWVWVVAILAILLLGAGGGAAVYYLGLL